MEDILAVLPSLCDRGDESTLYRVSKQVSDLGWVDSDFCYSAVCLILLGLMRDRQNRQISWAIWVEHPNQS